MSLIQCPDCGRDVSSSAPACPNCGAPVASLIMARAEASPKRRTLGCTSLFVVVVVVGILASALIPEKERTGNESPSPRRLQDTQTQGAMARPVQTEAPTMRADTLAATAGSPSAADTLGIAETESQSRILARSDSALGGAFAVAMQLARRLSDSSATRLRAEERDWIVKRDKECGFDSARRGFSTLRDSATLGCFVRHTQLRTRELQALSAELATRTP